MKLGFPRSRPESVKPPVEIRPEAIPLPTPLKVPPPEPKPWWIVAVAVGVVGIVVAMVVVSFASGSRTFNGAYSIFPLMIVFGVVSMLFGGRFGGGQQHSRGKMDALRARFMVFLDELRARVGSAADALDTNYRWYHPPAGTLEAALGGPLMWARSPGGKDAWFGVARVGVGMTALTEAEAVVFSEPQDMPTPIEMEPATGKALQEFVRYQSVAYGTPALISLLVEPGYRLDGSREQALGLMRALICQLVFAHGPDHLRLVVVTDDAAQWDWVKWLPHAGDPAVEDAAGPVRLVYASAAEFAAAQDAAVFKGRDAFRPRHAAVLEAVAPMPHTVVVADIAGDRGWESLVGSLGVEGVTFFDLRGGVPPCAGAARVLTVGSDAVVQAVPRDGQTWAADEQGGLSFFALADQMSRVEAERFAMQMARWRLTEAYEIGDAAEDLTLGRPRDILAYWGITDPAHIDFHRLWSQNADINSPARLRVPFGNRTDTGELLLLDMKDMNQGGDGPHGIMSGTTGSGKTTALRTVLESIMLGHPPENVQMVLADLKGGAGVKPFEGCPHVSHVITDLEKDQGGLLDRFIDAMWGEIARRKQICSTVDADDAEDYNIKREEQARRGNVLPPLPALVVVIDEFKELFRIKPTAVDVLDQIGRQGRSYWVHMLMASQDIDTRAEKLLENVGYRMVLKQATPASAAAAGVPSAVNLPKVVGLGYLRLGTATDASSLVKFQVESLWRDYRAPRDSDDHDIMVTPAGADYLAPQLFTTSVMPLPASMGGLGQVADGAVPLSAVGGGDAVAGDSVSDGVEDEDDPAEDEPSALGLPKVGLVIRDQLRQVAFEPFRLWCPPLDAPLPIDTVVAMRRGKPWTQDYGVSADLVFPVGIIDRPFKQDQQPLLVEAAGSGASVLVLGGQGSGKTTMLQTLVCSAALTHSPEAVQFYVLALGSPVLGSLAELPHVGSVAYALDEDGIRGTTAQLMELLAWRQRSFPECGVNSIEQFRRRKFGGEPGAVPEDPYGDVFLVVDDFKALTDDTSTIRGRENVVAQISTLILQGRSFGIHVMVSAAKDNNLPHTVRNNFPQRIELRLPADSDATNVKAREAAKVPVGRPGRGMVAQNYAREGVDPVGLHLMIARPALSGTPGEEFDSASVATAVRRAAAGYRPAPGVRRLPARLPLGELRAAASAAGGPAAVMWGVNESARPIAFDGPHLIVTGQEDCGRTTLCRTVLAEISRVYAPGASTAVPNPADPRERAQVWLISPRRDLLRDITSDYLQDWAYQPEGIKTLMANLAEVLASRAPAAGLSLEESLAHTWSGPRVFLVIDDAERVGGSSPYDSPLGGSASNGMTTAQLVSAAADVGLQVLYTRSFGSFTSAGGRDPIISAMMQANAPLLLMDSNPDPGAIIGKFRGHSMSAGRGLLILSAESGRYCQVATTEEEGK
ncbi:MAG: segregation ATPase FtsK/SpoIIIE, family [Actinomycetota bacterium]|nr:segregation ATPase FtsK/SpoIIIE, family [Actinomycetota bacterium]